MIGPVGERDALKVDSALELAAQARPVDARVGRLLGWEVEERADALDRGADQLQLDDVADEVGDDGSEAQRDSQSRAGDRRARRLARRNADGRDCESCAAGWRVSSPSARVSDAPSHVAQRAHQAWICRSSSHGHCETAASSA